MNCSPPPRERGANPLETAFSGMGSNTKALERHQISAFVMRGSRVRVTQAAPLFQALSKILHLLAWMGTAPVADVIQPQAFFPLSNCGTPTFFAAAGGSAIPHKRFG
jgi:hypothetical protein